MVSSSIIFKIHNSYFITLNIFIHLTIVINFQFYIHASVAVSKHKILHNFVILLHHPAGAVRCSATWLMLIFLTQNRISWNNVHLLSRTSYILHPTPATSTQPFSSLLFQRTERKTQIETFKQRMKNYVKQVNSWKSRTEDYEDLWN